MSSRHCGVAVSMYEENRISYIEPSAATSKEQEVLSKSKGDKHISIVDGGTRRGLALDQANLLRFRLHDSWVERLMEVRHTAPPPGYSAVTHQQILSADRKLFVKVAETTREGVQLQPAGRLFFSLPCRARHDSSDGRSRLHTIRTQFKRNKRSRPWGKQTKQATKQQNTTPKPNKKPQTRQPAKPSPKIEITQVKR